ncbi:MAG: hypothetical protein M3409_05430 [Gemmatimonadota bacterium]|nr:hypothetical protein [Gemmatimonadota bacterium]
MSSDQHSETAVQERIAHAPEDERRRRRVFLWALLSFLGSLLAGLVLCAWGLHSSHPVMGPALFEAGVLLTNAGVLIILLVTLS